MTTRPILNTTRAVIGAGLAMVAVGGAAAAPVGTPAPRPVHGLVVADAASGAANRDAPGSDLAQSRNAARSRMRECGHQWSSMKKNGSAAGLTWKDFSQGCLAKQ